MQHVQGYHASYKALNHHALGTDETFKGLTSKQDTRTFFFFFFQHLKLGLSLLRLTCDITLMLKMGFIST